MKELLTRFRFGDFSAYFLPGLVMLGAVAAGWSLLALPSWTRLHDVGLAESALIACSAYVCGAVISGSSYKLIAPIHRVTRFRRYVDPRCSVQPPELTEVVEAALEELLGTRIASGWSEDHFYLARTAVHERLPQTSAEAMRQNDLMRLRENMLIPVLAWCVVGTGAVIVCWRSTPVVAALLIIAMLFVTYLTAGRVACRSVDNRGREVREICVGFLIGHRMGLFRPSTAPSRVVAAGDATIGLPFSSGDARLPVTKVVGGSS